MQRTLSISPRFRKKLEKFLKHNPDLERRVEYTLQLLQKDPFTPSLDTHRLHGILAKFFSCKITYHHRLVFSMDEAYIYPHAIGSHDEVY